MIRPAPACLAVLLLVTGGALAAAPATSRAAVPAPRDLAPRTLYRPADYARAKANIARYPWAAEIYARLKAEAAPLLKMDREAIRAFIPRRTPLAAIKCPVCGEAPWSWYNLLENGAVLECDDCKTRWTWDPADDSETWNIPAVFRYYRLIHILDDLDKAVLVYRVEGDKDYARPVAAAVERFAEVFRNYRVNMIHKNQWLDRNDPYYAKIAGWKHREMVMVGQVLFAYDGIRDSGALTGAAIETIDRDLVRYTLDYLADGYGPGGPASPDSLQDQGSSWRAWAACAVLLDDRPAMRVMTAAFDAILDPANGMFYDDGGFFQGSPAYQRMFTGPITVIPEILSGHLPDDIYASPFAPQLDKIYAWTLDFLYPDGTIPPVNDAHVGDRQDLDHARLVARRFGNAKAARYLADRRAAGAARDGLADLFEEQAGPGAATASGEPYSDCSVHFSGSGLMTLRHGADAASRTMLFLDYGAFEPPNKPPYHKHRDYLNVGLWALGREMLSEMGYAMTPPWIQRWQVSPLAHNSVLETAGRKEGGRPLLWYPSPGPQIAEAGLPPEDSRFVVLLPREGAAPIVVDIFRVAGKGEGATWALHGRSDKLEVTGVDGWSEAPAQEPLRGGRAARAAGGAVEAVWRFDATEGRSEAGLKVVLPMPAGRTIVVSRCPAEEDRVKTAFGKGGTPLAGVELPTVGHLQVRSAGPEAVFAAVHVPFEGPTPPVVTVSMGPQASVTTGPLGLKIEVGEETFIVVHNPGAGPFAYEGLACDGRAAVATLRAGEGGRRPILRSLALGEGRSAVWEKQGIYRSTIGNGFKKN